MTTRELEEQQELEKLKQTINIDTKEQAITKLKKATTLYYQRSVDSLNTFFTMKSPKDLMYSDDGLVNLQQTIEYIVKGILQFYLVEYEEVHPLHNNLVSLVNLIAKQPELKPLSYDVYTLLKHEFTYEVDSWYYYAKYSHVAFKKHILAIIQKIATSMVRFVKNGLNKGCLFTTDTRQE